MDQTEKKNIKKRRDAVAARKNIRCRKCFMVSGYLQNEEKCVHCGAKIYWIDLA